MIKDKVLGLFFDFPTQRFHTREIARKLNVSAPAVSKVVNELEKEGLVTYKKKFISEIQANLDDKFKKSKRIHNLRRIYEIGLEYYLKENFPLTTIVLFGSYSRGEDIEKSDIDIAIFSKEKRLDIAKFEKKLNRTINIEFIDFRKASVALKESLINGIVLEGDIVLK